MHVSDRPGPPGTQSGQPNLQEVGARMPVLDLVLTVLLFLLLREWMGPLEQVAGQDAPAWQSPFAWALGAFLLLDGLRVPGWASWPLKLAAACFAVQAAAGPSASGGWLSLLEQLAADGAALANGNPEQLGAAGRALLYIGGWAMLASVLQAVLLAGRRMHWLVAATLGYLIVLQLGYGAAAEGAALRTLAAGTALAGLQQYAALRRQAADTQREGTGPSPAVGGWGWTALVLPLACCVVLAGLAGAASRPGEEGFASWQAAKEQLRRTLAEASAWPGSASPGRLPADLRPDTGGAAARTGFTAADRRLGGPVTPDASVAFTALTEVPTYWRGDVKSYYDGTGWRRGEADEEELRRQGTLIGGEESSPAEAASAAGPAPRGRLITQEIRLEPDGPRDRLFAGGTIVRIEAMTDADGTELPADARPGGAASPRDLVYYRLKVELPSALPTGEGQAAAGVEGAASQGQSTGDAAASAGEPAAEGQAGVGEGALQGTASPELAAGGAGAAAEPGFSQERNSGEAAASGGGSAVPVAGGAEQAVPTAGGAGAGPNAQAAGAASSSNAAAAEATEMAQLPLPSDAEALPTLAAAPEPRPSGQPAVTDSVNGGGGTGIRWKPLSETVTPDEALRSQPELGELSPSPLSDAYLQLPDTLPARVRELARTVTAGAKDDLARAEAVASYLRTHYRYTLSPAPPSRRNADFVDAFLFEGKEGYCDYFSTAMVVLLRAAGVPARWVSGFAPGEVGFAAAPAADGQPRYAVTVRNLDAHSWAEVYVAGAGWQPFEPTPGFPGAPAGESAPPAPAKAAAEGLAARLAGRVPGAALAAVLAALAAGTACYAALRRSRVRLAAGDAPPLPARGEAGRRLRRLEALGRRLYRLEGPPAAHMTVREYVAALEPCGPAKREALAAWARLVERASFAGPAGPPLGEQELAEVRSKLEETVFRELDRRQRGSRQ
ncbi:transglutaminase family protein [Paenibacillus sp. J31TS4]|uniref:transglutaminase-like domain-containing protein n=1 Tax=Paenibacillus sp. J31TS4 TaxID=2807195 RepID=UPI0020BFE817|nr:transglutaminase-like domain-containing protein [Paenibacillus sp. J31TS4]